MKLRAVLIEDEPHSRDRLRSLLAVHADVEIVGEAGDGVSAVALIDASVPTSPSSTCSCPRPPASTSSRG